MLTPNSSPARPSAAARAEACGRRAPPPQIRRSVLVLDPCQFSVQLHDEPADARVRHQQVRPRPRPLLRRGRPRSAHSSRRCSRLRRVRPAAKYSAGPPVRIVVSRASGKSRSTPSGSVRHHGALTSSRSTSRSARRSTSPAPSVTSTSPSRELAREHRARASSIVGQPPDRPPAGVVGGRVGDQLAGHARRARPRAARGPR